MEIYKVYIYFFSSLIISNFTIKYLIFKSHFLGLVDLPNKRKIHKVSTPIVGGLGIVITFFIIMAISWLFNWHLIYLSLNKIYILLLGTVIIVLTGLIDDIKGLTAKDKFLFQIIASLIVVIGMVDFQLIDWPLSNFFNSQIYNSFLSIFYIVSILNAINLIDGLDGLAGGVSIIISITFLFLSYLSGSKIYELYLLIILIGSLFGFIINNKPPAKTFLGDTGSLFLGWLFAINSLVYAQKTTFSLSILIPIMVLGMPAFDVLFVMIKRFNTRHNYNFKNRIKSLFKPDNNHLHHIIISYGFSKIKALILLYLLTLITCIIALYSFFNNETTSLIYGIIFILIIIFVIRFLLTWLRDG